MANMMQAKRINMAVPPSFGAWSDEVNLSTLQPDRRARRYTAVQVDEAKLVRGAFPDW